MAHLWEAKTNTWRNFEVKMARLRSVPQWLRDLTSKFLVAITQATGITRSTQINSDLWSWSNNSPTNGGFTLPNSQVYALLQKKSKELMHLNTKWGRTDDKASWNKRWKKLWGLDLTKKAKIWLICSNGLFTQERAQKLGRGN